VLIYYAFESNPTPRDRADCHTIIAWLGSAGSEKADRPADSLETELVEFPAVVAAETDAIRRHLPTGYARLAAVVLTNRLVRSGRYHYLLPGEHHYRVGRIDPPAAADYVLDSNRLAMRETLRRALAEVARRFQPANHDFVLITKGHGQPQMALTVRLVRKHEEISRDELLAAIEDPGSATPPTPTGITKDEYFEILRDAGDPAWNAVLARVHGVLAGCYRTGPATGVAGQRRGHVLHQGPHSLAAATVA
jgi:hypothetical protein